VKEGIVHLVAKHFWTPRINLKLIGSPSRDFR
jgi:hypothetical protein